jgi:hypothetical protein
MAVARSPRSSASIPCIVACSERTAGHSISAGSGGILKIDERLASLVSAHRNDRTAPNR